MLARLAWNIGEGLPGLAAYAGPIVVGHGRADGLVVGGVEPATAPNLQLFGRFVRRLRIGSATRRDRKLAK
jgi:hypothetical protein